MEQNNSEKPQETVNNETGTTDNSVNTEEKPAENKKSESPEAQEAVHTATTAMSESAPMSGINGKKILKTLLSNIFTWIMLVSLSVTISVILKFSADNGNLVAQEQLADKSKNNEIAAAMRNQLIDEYHELDKKEQVKYNKAYKNAIRKRKIRDDKEEALGKECSKDIKNAAFNDHPESQFIVGTWYAEGKCYPTKNIEEAKKFFMKSIEGGYGPAKISLGEIYESEGNINEAIKLYKESAQNQNMRALYNIGKLYNPEDSRASIPQAVP